LFIPSPTENSKEPSGISELAYAGLSRNESYEMASTYLPRERNALIDFPPENERNGTSLKNTDSALLNFISFAKFHLWL
jgi:O-acetylhomoserine/O-acetylserine sulfhydrylase-like pyridoxal-dependent enzyme